MRNRIVLRITVINIYIYINVCVCNVYGMIKITDTSINAGKLFEKKL